MYHLFVNNFMKINDKNCSVKIIKYKNNQIKNNQVRNRLRYCDNSFPFCFSTIKQILIAKGLSESVYVNT